MIKLIKNGIALAMIFAALTCIVVLLNLFDVPLFFLPRFDRNLLFNEYIQIVFLATAALGFLTSLFLSNNDSFISKTLKSIAILTLPIFMLTYFSYTYARRVSAPKHLEIAESNDKTLDANFTVPDGHSYRLELKTDEEGNFTPHPFKGSFSIFDGETLIGNYVIDQKQAIPTELGYFLCGNIAYGKNPQTNLNKNLAQNLVSGKKCLIKINFEPPLPSHSSLWLDCNVSLVDKHWK